MTVGEPAEPRELLGRLVREIWTEWAQEQPGPKPSWLLPWESLDCGQREVDMRIGTTLFRKGQEVGRQEAPVIIADMFDRIADSCHGQPCADCDYARRAARLIREEFTEATHGL